jgi:hypothetical protein
MCVCVRIVIETISSKWLHAFRPKSILPTDIWSTIFKRGLSTIRQMFIAVTTKDCVGLMSVDQMTLS